MSRLSREKKREQKQAAHAASPAAPIDVHVPGAVPDPGAGGASEGASVGGVRVFAAPGEEIQHAVLGRLHHIALATGHPVLATVHDERIGYVVPLRVDPDGSSHFTSEPLRTPPAGSEDPLPPAPAQTPGSGQAALAQGRPAPMPPAGPVHTPPRMPPAGPVHAGDPAGSSPPAFTEPSRQERAETASSTPAGPERPEGDRATHVLRPVPQPAPGTTPTFPLRAVPEPQPSGQPVPTFELRAVQEPAPQDTPPATPQDAPPAMPQSAPPAMPQSAPLATPQDASPATPPATSQDTPPAMPQDTPAPPGTVAPPTGAFGPPPPMDARPLPGPESGHAPMDVRPLPGPESGHAPMDARPLPGSESGHAPMGVRPLPVPGSTSGGRAEAVPEAALLASDPDPKPTPARGFDAVAEAVLGDEPLGAPGDSAAPALLAEPVARINEAVKEGRIDAAAELADRTVAQASQTLGPEHPEVLRLRELTAYIAYLAGDPLRAFHLSLDLAAARRRAGDAEGAYGNVRSAATAWRAVRDPALGLELGRGLVGLWTELASEGGPAAEEIEELESARARMGRLTARAARS
ncbi:tetratricopeptide repeat protein [Streptomyces sp. NPDC085932]|uniref:tetratricopeptide repeat protein n=1 Tax=Streptomyces sp. NPDC085932 TaxID=3365741 RepID=UPI0037D27F10